MAAEESDAERYASPITLTSEYERLLRRFDSMDRLGLGIVGAGFVAGALAVLLCLTEDDEPTLQELKDEIQTIGHGLDVEFGRAAPTTGLQ